MKKLDIQIPPFNFFGLTSKKSKKTILEARQAAFSSMLFSAPPLSFGFLFFLWGGHKAYLGKHISWFFYLYIEIIVLIHAFWFDFRYGPDPSDIGFWLLGLIPILSLIDWILLFIPKYQESLAKLMKTGTFENEIGQYPINNPIFVYVVLATITFSSIICFWLSNKIVCPNNALYRYLDKANGYYAWIINSDTSNLLNYSSNTNYRIMEDFWGYIFGNKITGVILLFIGVMIFIWHYQSKSKPSLSLNNQNMPNIPNIPNVPNNNFQSNDEVTNALANLKRLYDAGAITEAEYNEKRQKYLDSL